MKQEEKPTIGISSCLIGKKVRYDGRHKKNQFLANSIADYFDYIEVCPEVACGMGVPRPAMHLYRQKDKILLVDRTNHKIDYTEQMMRFARNKSSEGLNGFVFKAKSPTCGIARVPIYNDRQNTTPDYSGVGLFAQTFMRNNPTVPIEDEGRLNDSHIRENFFERVYAHHRFYAIESMTVEQLFKFHTSYKFSIMARGSEYPSILGRIAASARHYNIGEVKWLYFTRFMQIMKIQTTRNKHINAMQHVVGYFKNQLDSVTKKEILKVFRSYKNNEVPLSTPMALLNLFQRQYKNEYISSQYYLNPYPQSLALRANI